MKKSQQLLLTKSDRILPNALNINIQKEPKLHHERTLGEAGAENNENFNDQAVGHSLRKRTVNRSLLFDQVRDMLWLISEAMP